MIQFLGKDSFIFKRFNKMQWKLFRLNVRHKASRFLSDDRSRSAESFRSVVRFIETIASRQQPFPRRSVIKLCEVCAREGRGDTNGGKGGVCLCPVPIVVNE